MRKPDRFPGRPHKFKKDKPFTLNWWMYVQSNIIRDAIKTSWEMLASSGERKRTLRAKYDKLQRMARYIAVRLMDEYGEKP